MSNHDILKYKAQDVPFEIFLPKMLNIFVKSKQDFRSKLQVTGSRRDKLNDHMKFNPVKSRMGDILQKN